MSAAVVVIRARGRDVAPTGQVRFGEVGSGVLISVDGKVMTAAHVVHAMDEITVDKRMCDHLQTRAPGAIVTLRVLRAGHIVELKGPAP